MPPPPPPPPPRRGGAPLKPGQGPPPPRKSTPTPAAAAAAPSSANTSAGQQEQARPRPAPIIPSSNAPLTSSSSPLVVVKKEEGAETKAVRIKGEPTLAGTTPVNTSALTLLSGERALLSASAVECWRAEYLATLANVAAGVGERMKTSLRRLRRGTTHISTKEASRRTRALQANKTQIKKSSSSAHARTSSRSVLASLTIHASSRGKRRACISSSLLPSSSSSLSSPSSEAAVLGLCAQLKAHYVSHLKQGLRAAPLPTRRGGGGGHDEASSVLTERLYCVGGEAEGDGCDFTAINAALSSAASGSFRADDVSLFNASPAFLSPSSPSSAASPTTGMGGAAPLESLTKLIVESQLMRKRLSTVGAPLRPTSSTPSSSYHSLSSPSVKNSASHLQMRKKRAPRLNKYTLLDRRVLDRQLGGVNNTGGEGVGCRRVKGSSSAKVKRVFHRIR